MPSTAVLERKKQMVADLSERIKNSCAGVVVDYKGINVEDDTKLRKELREAGVDYTVQSSAEQLRMQVLQVSKMFSKVLQQSQHRLMIM